MLARKSQEVTIFKVILLALCVGTLEAQTPATITVIDHPRPLADAAKQLAFRYDWLISYEDQAYIFKGDKQVSSLTGMNARRVRLAPKHSSVNVTVKASNPQDVLEKLVAEHAKNTGTVFQIKRSGLRYVLAPEKARDEKGNLVPQHSLLDTPITISDMERDGEEAGVEICKALSVLTGLNVRPGIGMGLLGGNRVRLSAVGEPAREVLVRLLSSVREGDHFVWRLYHGPNEQGGEYTLNIDNVREEFASSKGVKRLQ
jgi:hypothetical protein